jgi:hypothetical protein
MVIPEIEKMQFIYSEEQKWEFNYLLTGNGEVIGTPKSYNNRTKFIEGVIESNKLIKSNETD